MKKKEYEKPSVVLADNVPEELMEEISARPDADANPDNNDLERSETDVKSDKTSEKKIDWRKKALKSWFGFFLKLAVVGVIVWTIFTYVFAFAVVDGTSMSPNLADGDLTLIYRLQDDFSPGEVVAYKVDGKTYFGRIVAVSGDSVDMSDTGNLYVNNVEQLELNIFEETYKEGSSITFPAVVEESHYFILGDKRGTAHDSREFGTISEDDIVGIVSALLRRRGF